ncbi:hypothetical protein RHGRI_012161 [Rhododendron griersonianum]|uniref:Uncharacterized protein n=1 Tax=Rhododendron griersonianum TaxID=479676 RepID=A0AAV6KPF4_9ERIC|nr:hypothetical protein RHGRI_012161 [Rhododendron griersonianum]
MNCCNDDEEYQSCEDEKGMSSREDVSSRFQANKVDEQAKALAELSKTLTKHTRTMAVLQDIVRVLAVKAAVDPTDIVELIVELIEMSNNVEGASDKRRDAGSIGLSKG